MRVHDPKASMMAQHIKALVTKPDSLSSIHGTQVPEEKD